ncbi:MAG: histidinol-phosphatase [Rhodospirillaceae bacterium]|nr:histidinol-phosphatase [Rhodospirillaceae bacterium]
MSQYIEFIKFSHRLADLARTHTLPHFRAQLDVVDKGDRQDYSPVTVADREAEAAMRALIGETYPDHGILGEEHGAANAGGGRCWVLDPIDGTKSFIIGVPLWGTLIAFNDGSGPVVGVMDQPVTGERFVGHDGGSFLGDRRLKTRPCERLKDAVLCTTGPELFEEAAEQEAFAALRPQVRLARYGTDCYAYCMLAHGLVDLVVEAGLKPWDIQALIPIIRGAGGIVTTWDGGDPAQGGRIVAAGDPALHALALDVLATAT